MYTIQNIPKLGEVSFYISTIDRLTAFGKCALGEVRLKFRKFSFPDDVPEEFGWVSMESYTINGITTPCRVMRSVY